VRSKKERRSRGIEFRDKHRSLMSVYIPDFYQEDDNNKMTIKKARIYLVITLLVGLPMILIESQRIYDVPDLFTMVSILVFSGSLISLITLEYKLTDRIRDIPIRTQMR